MKMIAKIMFLLAFSSMVGCRQQEKASTPAHQQPTTQQPAKKSPQTKKHPKKSTNPSAHVQTLWNNDKNQELSAFMQQWQTKMSQSYLGTYDGKKPSYRDNVFPDVLINGQLQDKVNWGALPIALQWSPKGDKQGEYQVVAVASENTTLAETYFFTIHNGHPLVFEASKDKGDLIYLYDSQNVELQQGFAKILTGKIPVSHSDNELNQDAAAQIAQQQIPSAYRHTWYWQDQTTHNIENFDLTNAQDLRLDYYTTTTPQWLNVRTAQQTAGVGNDIYVRYRYFDGQQVPVAMMASGAGIWFDNNAYLQRRQAQIMDTYTFGDEPKGRDDE